MGKLEITRSWPVKHRPKRWSEIVGQESAVQSLQGMLKRGSIPGAVLFSGPAGCGKTTLARLFARYLNCSTNDACGKCDSCMIDMNAHPDVTEGNAAEKRGIDEIRTLISQSKYRPRYTMRVFILDEAHQLTPHALEAFLKPLEEPQPHTVYFICTTEPDKFKDTFLSRCSKITVGFPEQEQMEKRLRLIAKREKIEFDPQIIQACVQASTGHIREAISLLEQAANVLAVDPKTDPQVVIRGVSGSASPETTTIASRMLIGLYAGSDKMVAKAAYDMQDALQTINACMFFNQYVLGTLLESQSRQIWHSPANREFKKLAMTKLGERLTLASALAAHRKLVHLRGLIHTVAGTELGLVLAHLTGK